MKKEKPDLTVLRCHHCSNTAVPTSNCRHCAGTGSIFWVAGRSVPYTPEGEKSAIALQKQEDISPSLAALIKAGMA